MHSLKQRRLDQFSDAANRIADDARVRLLQDERAIGDRLPQGNTVVVRVTDNVGDDLREVALASPVPEAASHLANSDGAAGLDVAHGTVDMSLLEAVDTRNERGENGRYLLHPRLKLRRDVDQLGDGLLKSAGGVALDDGSRVAAVLADAGKNLAADPIRECFCGGLITTDHDFVEAFFSDEESVLLSSECVDDLTSGKVIPSKPVCDTTYVREAKNLTDVSETKQRVISRPGESDSDIRRVEMGGDTNRQINRLRHETRPP